MTTDAPALDLPRLVGGAGLLLVANPAAGRTVPQPDPIAYVRTHLPRALVHELGDDEDLVEVVARAFAGDVPPLALAACGGDGSVSTMAHLARLHDVPLVVVPGGTFNHFARTARVGTVVDAVLAVRAGTGIAVDVAEVRFGDDDPVTVVNAASVGLHPRLVAIRERLQPRLGKSLGSVVASWWALRTADTIDVELDGRAARVFSLFVGVDANDSAVAAPFQRAALAGGVLDVSVLTERSRLRALAGLAFGARSRAVLRAVGLFPHPSRLHRFTADRVEIVVHPTHDQPPGVAHDGELDDPPGDEQREGYRSTVTIVPAGLRVYRVAGGRDVPR